MRQGWGWVFCADFGRRAQFLEISRRSIFFRAGIFGKHAAANVEGAGAVCSARAPEISEGPPRPMETKTEDGDGGGTSPWLSLHEDPAISAHYPSPSSSSGSGRVSVELPFLFKGLEVRRGSSTVLNLSNFKHF